MNQNNKTDEYYMMQALKEAKKAYKENEVPVGCVIVKDDKIIARAHNKREKMNNVFSHAEILAITKASKKLNSWILDDCTLYVTLEPCMMCSGSILQSRIKRLVYATNEPKFGVVESKLKVFDEKSFNHKVLVTNNILQDASSKLLKDFFKELRNK